MSRDPIENADQPPEVDIHDGTKRLPPTNAAAHRVIEFLQWWGDGQINTRDEGPPLYSRDLEVVAKAALNGGAE